MGPRWAPRGLLAGFGVAFGGFGEGLGRVWAGIWEDLESHLERFGEGFRRALELQNCRFEAAWFSLGHHVPFGTPAMSRSASTIRGGSPQAWLNVALQVCISFFSLLGRAEGSRVGFA